MCPEEGEILRLSVFVHKKVCVCLMYLLGRQRGNNVCEGNIWQTFQDRGVCVVFFKLPAPKTLFDKTFVDVL